jgi:KDO2-lipid IV(A) lauroyltransferase
VLENLRIAFGEAEDPAARRRLAAASCRALARVLAETVVADRLVGSPSLVRRRMRFHGAWDALLADAARGRGGLVVTGHLGNWELGAYGVRHHGVDLRVMARPLDDPVLEELIRRRRGGSRQVIPKIGGLRAVVRALRAGRWVAMLADQNAGRHGVFVPFFGLDASTFPTPAALASRLDVPLYFGACVRRPGADAPFDVHLERVDPPDSSLPPGERVERLLRDLNARLEAWVRRAPDQYNWAHRRWKTRPAGEAADAGEPFYARRPVPATRARPRIPGKA